MVSQWLQWFSFHEKAFFEIPGVNVTISKIFLPLKIVQKYWLFSATCTEMYAGKISHHWLLRKTHFFAENWRKSPKIMMLPLTPDHLISFCSAFTCTYFTKMNTI
jgi:hypothetical protein